MPTVAAILGETTMRFMRARPCVALLLALVAASSFAQNKDIPCDTVDLIVPWKPRGGTDIIFRVIARSVNQVGMVPRLQIVNVDGLGGAKGTRVAARAKANGCTLLGVHQSIITSYFAGRLKFTWDAFEPITLLTATPAMVGANKALPYGGVDDLVMAAKAKPDSVLAGSTIGSTSHFLLLMIEHGTGVRFRHVNYDGATERIQALLKGDIAIGEINLAAAKAYINDDAVKALGVSTGERHRILPGVKTLREQGVDVVFSTDRGIVAPKGTPPLITRQYETAFARAVRDPIVLDALEKNGTTVKYLNRKDYRAYLEKTYAQWEKIAIEVGMYRP
jgi:tripartite-type tricarboxylate transporter receptor subunit TctC